MPDLSYHYGFRGGPKNLPPFDTTSGSGLKIARTATSDLRLECNLVHESGYPYSRVLFWLEKLAGDYEHMNWLTAVQNEISNSRETSDGNEQIPYALRIRHDLVGAEFAISKNPVDKRDRHLADGVSQSTSAYHHFHLEHVAFGHGFCYDMAQYW